MSSEADDFPDCIICKTRKANILFDCVHNNSCSRCTFVLSRCPECYKLIEDRLLMIFSNNDNKLTLITYNQ